jgi:hypothetical protein
MNSFSKPIVLLAVALAVSACGAVDRLTGQTDNTVLPGQREEAIPGRAQFPDAPDPLVASSSRQVEQAPPDDGITSCQPDDPDCAPATGDDTFSDPQ